MWCGMMWYGKVWYGMVLYGMVLCVMIFYGMVKVLYGLIWCGMVLYGMVLHCILWCCNVLNCIILLQAIFDHFSHVKSLLVVLMSIDILMLGICPSVFHFCFFSPFRPCSFHCSGE